ncbi:hypothetical protein FKM82_007586 [Ascaphus truei]
MLIIYIELLCDHNAAGQTPIKNGQISVMHTGRLIVTKLIALIYIFIGGIGLSECPTTADGTNLIMEESPSSHKIFLEKVIQPFYVHYIVWQK